MILEVGQVKICNTFNSNDTLKKRPSQIYAPNQLYTAKY